MTPKMDPTGRFPEGHSEYMVSYIASVLYGAGYKEDSEDEGFLAYPMARILLNRFNISLKDGPE